MVEAEYWASDRATSCPADVRSCIESGIALGRHFDLCVFGNILCASVFVS